MITPNSNRFYQYLRKLHICRSTKQIKYLLCTFNYEPLKNMYTGNRSQYCKLVLILLDLQVSK